MRQTRQRPRRTHQHTPRGTASSGLPARRDAAHHSAQARHTRIESLRRGDLLYLLHHDPEREASHFGLYGHGLLCARVGETARRVQAAARHRCRRDHARRQILSRLSALRRCVRPRARSHDWRESLRPPASRRHQKDTRRTRITRVFKNVKTSTENIVIFRGCLYYISNSQ